MANALVCPFTELRYISSHGSRPANTPFLVILHTNAGSYPASNESMFNYIQSQLAAGNTPTQAHFQVGFTKTNQWLDINEKGVASYKAEGRCVSIETADNGSTAVPPIGPWSPYQIEMIAQIMAWMHAEWGIPLQFAKVALPTRIEDGGLGWHSMWGINTTFQPNLNPWTTVKGKTCPTAPRIAQMQQILDRAIQIATPPPPPPPGPQPVRKKKMQYFIQNAGGAIAITDGIHKRGVTQADIPWLMFLDLVKKNEDGSILVVAVTDALWAGLPEVRP